MSQPPALTHSFSVDVEVGAPIDLGLTPAGHRRVIPITGGEVRGPRLQGVVLPGGMDDQQVGPTLHELMATYVLRVGEGALVRVVNTGFRAGPRDELAKVLAGQAATAGTIRFRTTARLSTSAPGLDWLNHTLFLGIGQRLPTRVSIDFFAVE